LAVSLTWLGTGMHTEHPVDENQKEPSGPQSFKHIQDFLMEEFRLHVSYRILERLEVQTSLPIRHTMIEAGFSDANGDPLPGFVSIHHRTETLFGIGDMGIELSYAALMPSADLPLSVTVRLGATLPTGDIEPDPFKAGAMGQQHQHIFFGTGTVNPMFGLDLSYNLGPLRLHSATRAEVPVTQNREGYKAPTTLSSDVFAVIDTPVDGFYPIAGMGVFRQWRAHWGDQPAKNSGRTDVLLSAGISWESATGLHASILAKVPVAIETEGGQLKIPVLLQATLGGYFNLLD
jgi:hypothetical protein